MARRVGRVTGLVIGLLCLPGLFAAGGQAKPAPGLQASPTLTKLAADARSLLNDHLPTPNLDLRIEIGYATTPHEGPQSPADTFPGTTTETGPLGNKKVTHFCEIAVDRPAWDASYFTGGYDGTGKGDRDRALEIVTHEEFHCYQLQLLGPAYNDVPDWVSEGLPRWVDLSLFPANPLPSAAGDLEDYFKSPTAPLFTRKYDAVGFWSHLADVTHGFWDRIPKIVHASAHSNEATVDAALEGVTDEQFFGSWGSSAANPPGGDAAWTAESPFPPRDPYASAPRTINTAGAPNTQVSVPLDPYTTIPIRIDPPSAPAGEIETIRIDLDGAYGRFGVNTNYTGPALDDKTFCADATSCPTINPAPGSCPEASSPPTLTPLPADPLLGLAAAGNRENVHINYASVPMTATCTPSCDGSSARANSIDIPATTPPGDVLLRPAKRPRRTMREVFTPVVTAIADCTPVTGPVGNPAMAGTFGDPHQVDFDGREFDFQQAGEFTLLKSTRDDLQVQVRQQPLSDCCVAFNTAVAMRVGAKTVEVDAAGPSKLAVYVNKVRVHGTSLNLGGGDDLSVQPHASTPVATVTWADSTSVMVSPGTPVGSAALDIELSLAGDRAGHVEGILGNAGVPAAEEFAGRNGRRYPSAVITGTAKRDLRVRYSEFGASWRITQRESLFRYTRGKTTRSYDVRGFPRTNETAATLAPRARSGALKACRAAGIVDAQRLLACELDVGATGDKGFAVGDARFGPRVAGWTKLSSADSESPTAAISLAINAGKVAAAYLANQGSSVELATFAPTAAGPGKIAHATPISSWSELSDPILLPAANGGEQLMISGDHSGDADDPLNGIDLLQPQANGSYTPTGIDPDGPDIPDSALLASDGRSPLWSTDGVLHVYDGDTYPPTLSYPGPPQGFALTSKLARDTTGRLWLAWYQNSGDGSAGGIYLLQLDPATGAPAAGATPQLAPRSQQANALTLACNVICHVVYAPGSSTTELVSWAPGQPAPVVVASVHSPHQGVFALSAAAAPDGRIWIVYVAVSTSNQLVVELGNDNGAGGTPTMEAPPVKAGVALDGTALATSQGLVVAMPWTTLASHGSNAVWVTVVPQP